MEKAIVHVAFYTLHPSAWYFPLILPVPPLSVLSCVPQLVTHGFCALSGTFASFSSFEYMSLFFLSHQLVLYPPGDYSKMSLFSDFWGDYYEIYQTNEHTHMLHCGKSNWIAHCCQTLCISLMSIDWCMKVAALSIHASYVRFSRIHFQFQRFLTLILTGSIPIFNHVLYYRFK